MFPADESFQVTSTLPSRFYNPCLYMLLRLKLEMHRSEGRDEEV